MPAPSNLVVLRREIYSQTNEKIMERFREIADPSVCSDDGSECCRSEGSWLLSLSKYGYYRFT